MTGNEPRLGSVCLALVVRLLTQLTSDPQVWYRIPGLQRIGGWLARPDLRRQHGMNEGCRNSGRASGGHTPVTFEQPTQHRVCVPGRSRAIHDPVQHRVCRGECHMQGTTRCTLTVFFLSATARPTGLSYLRRLAQPRNMILRLWSRIEAVAAPCVGPASVALYTDAWCSRHLLVQHTTATVLRANAPRLKIHTGLRTSTRPPLAPGSIYDSRVPGPMRALAHACSRDGRGDTLRFLNVVFRTPSDPLAPHDLEGPFGIELARRRHWPR